MSDPKSEVVKKALTDAKFKAELLKDPKAALEKVLGKKLDRQVKVVEDSASTVHLVLPHFTEPSKGAMDDASLEKVAGGAITPFTGRCTGDSSLTWVRVC